jgi:hypothetical protein
VTRHEPCAWFRVRIIRVRSTYANRSRINLYINFISTSCLVDSRTYADKSHDKCFRQGSCHSVSTFVEKLFISDLASYYYYYYYYYNYYYFYTRQLRTKFYQMLANCMPNSWPEFCQKYARNISETCQTYVRNLPEICIPSDSLVFSYGFILRLHGSICHLAVYIAVHIAVYIYPYI